MSFDQGSIDRLADAVWRAHDPWARLAGAIHAAWTGPAAQAGGGEEVKMHAERQAGGSALLRMSAGGRSIEAVLDNAERLSLIRYLTAGK